MVPDTVALLSGAVREIVGRIAGIAGGMPGMVSVNVVVFGIGKASADIVIVYVPAGVEAAVAMVNTDVHVGVQEGEENEAVAPRGRPEVEKEKEIGATAPERYVAVMVLVTLWPAITVWSPALVREKSRAGVAIVLARSITYSPFSLVTYAYRPWIDIPCPLL